MPSKNIFFLWLFCFEGTFTSFFKVKGPIDSQNSRNQGFSLCFCLLMEGSGSVQINYGSGCGSRGPKTYGSGCRSGILLPPGPALQSFPYNTNVTRKAMTDDSITKARFFP
jgi:hypothetical protein